MMIHPATGAITPTMARQSMRVRTDRRLEAAL
jgi:hypothetical protein